MTDTPLNCKQGDLAIIVGGGPHLVGMIVTCVKFLGDKHDLSTKDKDIWEIDRQIKMTNNELEPWYPDQWMRPIRYTDGEDEMLTIAGNPNKEHA